MSFLRKRWKFVFGVAISVVFLWFSLRGLHLQAVWHYIQVANFWWILPAVAVYFAAVWARTWRWHYLLRPLKSVPLKRLFPIVCIGYFGNNVYPARAGEVIRAFVLRRNEGISVSASFATIIVERVFDGLVMLLFVFFALPFVGFEHIPAIYRVTVVVASRGVLHRTGRVSLDGLGSAAFQPGLSFLLRSAGAGAFPWAAGWLRRTFHVRVELSAQWP